MKNETNEQETERRGTSALTRLLCFFNDLLYGYKYDLPSSKAGNYKILECKNLDWLELEARMYLADPRWTVEKPIHIAGFFKNKARIILRRRNDEEFKKAVDRKFEMMKLLNGFKKV